MKPHARMRPAIECLTIDICIPSDRARQRLDEGAIERLMESMSKIGLKTPITVRGVSETGDTFLVAGRHRLEAAKRLGWNEIEAIILWDFPEDEARMWEISENLARAELTALERDEHVAEWMRLVEKPRQADAVSKGGRGNEGGVRAAARDLGLSEPDARRATKVANLSDEAKKTARETGLDDNRSALLGAAKSKDDVAFLRAEHTRREADRSRKETARTNRDTNSAISLSVAEEFADWIMERADLRELPTIISWIEGVKSKELIAALRRKAA